ncbi:hypothetical protein PhCBS80983_g01332 [Powellomyces hirtus]|uniref:RhoGAP-domain-containing protein n=1 Tax=Powellomyces hirtus TaxID=109895 RepID=A0A507EAI5_9FUNG|nr:hypothetical protein PhCBS80983_g01332 [Powellomyces hirtus]
MDGSRNDQTSRSERGSKRESPDVPGLETLLQNVIAERNALRLQNDQLWKIIEKQRTIIAQLQASQTNSVAAGGDASAISPMLGRSEVDAPSPRPPSSGPSPASRKHSAHRERTASDRPPSTTIENDSLKTTSVGEHPPGTSPRARSASDPHSNALILPTITINGGRNNTQRHPGSAHRERSASGSSSKSPTILPHVQGAAPVGLQKKSSSSRNSGGAMYNFSGDELTSSRSTGSGPMQNGSGSEPAGLGDAGTARSRTGSAHSASRSRKSQNPPSEMGESPPELSSGHNNRRSAEMRRKPMRPVSGRGARLTHVHEADSRSTTPEPPEPVENANQPEPAQLTNARDSDTTRREMETFQPEILERTTSLDRPKRAPSTSKARVRHSRQLPDEGALEHGGAVPIPIQQTDSAPDVLQEARSAPQASPAPPPTQAHPADSGKHLNLLSVSPQQMGSALSITMSGSGSPDDRSSTTKESPFRSLFKSTDQVKIAVTGSQIRVNDKGREVIGFTISIKDGTNADLWKVEKVYSDFLSLDMKLKANQSKSIVSKIGKLPEKSLFTTHSPSKSDQRKVQLELYLQNVKEICRDSPDLIQFLSTDVLESGKNLGTGSRTTAEKSVKEGYLFKKGKNFGAWKTRYFVLKPGGVLEYYESQKDRTNLLGCIKLKYVFVSRQSSSSPFDLAVSGSPTPPNGGNAQQPGGDTDYRHAFMLTEYKKSCFGIESKEKGADQFADSKVVSRHILCAENDEERDEWVRYVAKEIKAVRPDLVKAAGRRPDDDVLESPAQTTMSNDEKPLGSASVLIRTPMENGQSDPYFGQNIPYEREVENQDRYTDRETTGDDEEEIPVAPARTASIQILPGPTSAARPEPSPPAPGIKPSSPSLSGSKPRARTHVDDMERVMMQPEPAPLISLPESVYQSQTIANASTPPSSKASDKKSRRMTAFNWGKKSKDSLATTNSKSQTAIDPSRRVFGVPLDQAVAVSRVRDDLPLPAVIYRCIEYLDAKKANEEEGIYRLSGSSSVIQGLKAAFDNEGDYDILSSQQYYDVHAVAGLLKLYLRELPTPVLTKELQRSFLHVMDLTDRDQRIHELARLVALLPVANYALLKTLMGHLVRVVRRCDVNKMNVRNVGIVFSPTVGVPAGVFTLMMAEYASVFWWDGREETRANQDPQGQAQDQQQQPQQQQVNADDHGFDADVPSSSGAEEPAEELPVPKRRQPNSAKRRQRQHAMLAGLALVNGAEAENGRPAAVAINGDYAYIPPAAQESLQQHQQHQQQHPSPHDHQPQYMDSAVLPAGPMRSLPRPISAGSAEHRRSASVSHSMPEPHHPHQDAHQQQQHQQQQTPYLLQPTTATPTDADQTSISEVYVDGEEEVESDDHHADDDSDSSDDSDNDNNNASDDDHNDAHHLSTQDKDAARNFEAYFNDNADELAIGQH